MSQFIAMNRFKIVPGMESGDYPDRDAFEDALCELAQMKQLCKKSGNAFGGCFVWEYFDAPPGGKKDPTEWADQIASVLN